MSVSVEIQGLESARSVLNTLPDKMQAPVIRKIFTKAVKPVITDAKSRLLSYNPNFKKLANAIGVIPMSTKNPLIVVGVRAKGKYKDIGFIGHWIEYGVSGIKHKTSRTLTKPGDEPYRMWVSKVKKGERYRNDIAPQPFMRPAVDSRSSMVQKDVSDAIGKHLNNEVQKALARSGKR